MDRERFGRALGVGAREAARAVMKAADAAAAPDPKATRTAGAAVAQKVEQTVEKRVGQARAAGAGVKRGGKRFGAAVWAPLAKASGVLWLEVTGVLFGMFAVASGIAVWQDRGEFRAGGAQTRHAWFAVAMLVVFGYFTVSNYVRAARRSRR